jgi:Uma2 family endonuclease
MGHMRKAIAMALALPHHKFTGEEYAQMIATGIIAEDDRVELIRGEIITMNPIGPSHAYIVAVLNRILGRQVSDDVLIAVQNPIWLPDDSQTQPDLALVAFRDYMQTLPTPAEVLLVIEVADSSLAYDKQIKLPLYAAAGIPEAWLVDLAARRIERHTEPRADGYATRLPIVRGGTVTSTTVPGIAIALDTLFR